MAGRLDLATLFFRQRRLLLLVVGVVVVAGMAAFQTLPRSEDPTLTRRFATILTPFPGADAERVEALVTEKLEEALQEVEEIKTLESTSRSGLSVLLVELQDAVIDVDPIWSRVQNELDTVVPDLPAGVGTPQLERETITAFTLIVGVVWDQPGAPQYAILRRQAEALETALRGVPGTSDVELFGAAAEEVLIELNPTELAALDLTAAQVSAALRRADAKDPAGLLNHPDSNLLIEVTGEVETLDRVLNIPLRTGPDGQVVQVADVATVRKAMADPPAELTLVDGRLGIAVAARMQEGERVDRWARDAHAVVADFQAAAPPGLLIDAVFDQSDYVAARLNGLMINLLLAMGLVVGVVLVMMGWRSALAVGLALPFTSAMVLAGMSLLAVPMHQISVTGLIVALGLLIDNAIVITDEVRRRRHAGETPQDAIGKSVRHLAIPLFGSTFTTALAFMPIVLMPGPAGEFVGAIGLSVVLAIAASLFLSLTIIPTVAGMLEQAVPSRIPWGFLADGLQPGPLARGYRSWLNLIMRRPLVGVASAITLPLAGFALVPTLEEQFFPPADRDQVQIQLRLPTHTSLAATRQTVGAAQELLLDHPEVERVHWFLGTSAPKFYYNMMGNEDASPFYAQALVQLRSDRHGDRTTNALQALLDTRLPEGLFLVRQLEQGPPFSAPVELRLFGPDLAELRRLGDAVRAAMSSLPATTHTQMTLRDGRPKLSVVLDDEEARAAGLTNVDVAQQLQANFSGATGGSLLEETEQLPLRVQLRQRATVSDLAAVDVIAAQPGAGGGRYLPLAALGRLELRPEIASITRRNNQRVNTVQAYVAAGVLPNTVLTALQEELDQRGFALPPGYRLEIGGQEAERNRAIGNLLASLSVLIVLMIATLVRTFNSFRLAALLAVTAGLALGLGTLALWLGGYAFGFMAIVGCMGLVGVAMNDSIVVLAAIRENPAARDGDAEAIAEVTFRATRHVLATTITTIAGFTPLLIAGGDFWPPLATAIAGGVVGATLLALVLMPSVYRLLHRGTTASVASEPAEEGAGHPAFAAG